MDNVNNKENMGYDTNEFGNELKHTEPEFRKFNWAACFLGLPFAFGTGAWMCLLSLVPAVGWIFAIIGGMKGEEWAWKSGKFRSYETFYAVMDSWNSGGKVYGIITIVCTVIIILAYTALISISMMAIGSMA